jgi:hypothetical protein
MHKRALFLLGLIVLVSGGLGFFTLTRGHLWWDDFAGYLLQAKSILSWTMADFISHNTFTIQNSSYPPGPVAYPWGFPLLLAPVYSLFGLNPLALKLVGLVCYAGFVVCAAFLARTRLDELDALLLTGLLAFAPALISANDLILSDIPFLAFSTLSLILIERLPHKKSWPAGVAAGAAIFMAFFLRANGVLLLAPLLVCLLLAAWPDWKSALRRSVAPMLTFAGLFGLQAALFPGGQGSYLSHFSMFSLARLLDNLLYYLWLPASTFDQLPGGGALYLLLAGFALISLATHWRRDAALHVYSLLTVALFIIWPERQGLRFIYPVLPVLFIAGFDGLRLVIARLKQSWQARALGLARLFWGAVMLVCLGLSARTAYQITAAGREISGPFDTYSKQMYAFIREKTPADSVIIFMRPRALRLFTERDSFMTQRCEDLPRGDFVVLHLKMDGNGQIPPEQIGACSPALKLETAYQNKRFIVYQIKR